MSISSPIVPAIIPKSYEDLIKQVSSLYGLPELHLDVVDGEFANVASWPYLTNDTVKQSYDLLSVFSLEVDLMVKKPLLAARAWLEAGADQLVFHIETISAEALAGFTQEYDVTVALALSRTTTASELTPYLPYIDYVQVMGIAEIGTQGQPFDESVIDQIKNLHREFPNLPLSIDGSVNEVTIPLLRGLPLSRFIVGSAIMHKENPKKEYETLTTLVRS